MRAYLTEEAKKNEIRMLLKHPSYTGLVVIVVEGGSDVRLFRKLFDKSKIRLTSVTGKGPLEKMVSGLFSESNRVYGLRDADHDRLVSDQVGSECIFVTDEHDAEMMMIRSNAFDHVIAELSGNEDVDGVAESLRAQLFSAAYEIGALRFLNYLYNWNINFKALRFSEFVSANGYSVSINQELLVKNALDKSPRRPSYLTSELVRSHIHETLAENYCALQLCCGHDVTKIMELVYAQPKVATEGNINQKRIESSLRLGFNEGIFRSTELHNRIVSALDHLGDVVVSDSGGQ